VPITLVATAGGSTSNTYVTQADATTYFEGHPFASAWTSASTGNKDIALAYATRILDRVEWAGVKGSTSSGALTQALAFPRRWVPTLEIGASPEYISEDFVDQSVGYYDEDTIPTPLVRATCELALALLNAGTSDPFDQDASRIKSETVGPISTEWFDSQDAVRGLARFPHVLQLVQHMFRASADGVEVQRA
jgi:hypothetical protein